jgi:hypothetical protein
MNNKKRTIEDCQNWATLKGGKCLSLQYVNANTNLEWQCEHDHIWQATPNKIRMGSWCPECYRPNLTIQKCKEIAHLKGGLCLSTTYISYTSPITFECSLKHQWTTTMQSVKQGSWCPQCATIKRADTQRYSIENCYVAARHNDGLCLSNKYINADTKYKWQCKNGHIWYATYSAVKGGSWCKQCFNQANGQDKRNSIADACLLAESKNGKCISNEYHNAHSKLQWQCNICSHIWEATYNNIQRGRWCPKCQMSKTEKQVRQAIEQILNIPFPKKRLRYNNKIFELDCYNHSLKLGIEYDGEQHFIAVPYWGGESGLKKNQERDTFKNNACDALGITLIRVPYTQKTSINAFLVKQLQELGFLFKNLN